MKINLIIVPHQLINQWKYFLEMSKKINYITINNKKSFNDSFNKIIFGNINTILISNTKIDSFLYRYKNFKWNRIIIDEAESISINKTINLNCSFLWLISINPQSLRYSQKKYLNNIFKNICPVIFKHLIFKNNNSYIRESTSLPSPNRIIVNCRSNINLELIKNIVPYNIISLINAGNIDLAIKK